MGDKKTPACVWLSLVAIVLSLLTIGFTLGFLATRSVAVEPEPIEQVTGKLKQTEPVATESAVWEGPLPTYTAEELETLALVIYQEAGGDDCSDETRLMVGTVVLNRVADARYPDTIAEVVTEYRQYGRLYWTGLEWPERASKAQEAHAVKRAYDCAERLLDGYRALPADVIFQAEFTQGTEVVAHQDGFYFCR
jgi:hypothetical protein